LLKIKKAADEFGSGNYNARIPRRWWSPVKKISNAFNAMAEQTQNSIRQQKELTSAVSHELRTPVARMRFALEMLDSSSSKHDKTRFINDINEDINDLDLLLEELLSYARFDQKNHSINPRLEKLIPWLSNSMEKLMSLAGNKVLHYRVEGIGINETSLFDARLMTRALDNLVQNALRYAKHTVEVMLTKDHDNYLLIIEDDGIGISKDKREEIFNAFSRIDTSRDRASGGFGLGLAIVDRIVKAHLGNIIVLDSPLGGARFEIRIPAKTSKH
jgi:two-component system sensor histidine kinase RstB